MSRDFYRRGIQALDSATKSSFMILVICITLPSRNVIALKGRGKEMSILLAVQPASRWPISPPLVLAARLYEGALVLYH